ncbi:MAG: hypothetical protein R3F22_11085 [Lysobacteraceae bacterium]
MHTTEVLISAALLVALLELFALATWQAPYFSFGITVFRRTIKSPSAIGSLAGYLATEFDDFGAPSFRLRYQPMYFRLLPKDRIVFREALLWSHPLFFVGPIFFPVMRGVIRYADDGSVIELRGLVSWAVLLLVAACVAVVLAGPGHEMVVRIAVVSLPLGLLAWVYLIQRQRFEDVVASISQFFFEDRVSTHLRKSANR